MIPISTYNLAFPNESTVFGRKPSRKPPRIPHLLSGAELQGVLCINAATTFVSQQTHPSTVQESCIPFGNPLPYTLKLFFWGGRKVIA